MFRSIACCCCLLIHPLLLYAGDQETSNPVDADLLLQGGMIVDGTGSEAYAGDVAVRDGQIVAVGEFTAGKVLETIDCGGLIVAPGFIDLHNHSDRSIVDESGRANVNYLTQGCTTIVTGNCGFGPIDVAAYFDKIDSAGAGTNVVHLLPQGSLRDAVLGKSRRGPNPTELARMRQLAERAMRDGAYGMSTGLIYVPGTYAETDELVQVARVVARHGGIYASHIRNEGTELLDAVREAIAIGQQAGMPVHISHFKAKGPRSWGAIKAAASLIMEARREGARVTADQYPYIASSTSLEAMLIPTWAREGGHSAMLRRIDDPKQGARIREYIQQQLDVRGERAPIRLARYTPRPDWVGRTVLEVARAEDRDPVDLVIEIQQAGGASAVSFGMAEEDVRYAMGLEWVATASDGSSAIPAWDRRHPRSYGTFPRKIAHYALAEKVITLEQAVRSSSGLPADILGLADRGYLKPGQTADLAVFDRESLADLATFDDPYQYSVGMKYVFVAGKPAVWSGVPTGALAGRALRHESTAEGD